MANKIFVLGESGTGKSTSIRNLDPTETFILQCLEKELPFRGWKNKYTVLTKENLKGNRSTTKNYKNLHKQLKYINENKTEIKTVIIDDANYLMTHDFMSRIMEKNKLDDVFRKFNEIAYNFYHLLTSLDDLRGDLTVVLFAHTQTDDYGIRRFKTVGKLLDNMINLEGLVSVILESKLKEGKYVFQTNKIDGTEPCKTPLEMFDTNFIDNDLKTILETIKNYNN